jgi:hypothetical protein
LFSPPYRVSQIDLFGGLGQYFSWSFSIVSALLGLFVLCNLPTVTTPPTSPFTLTDLIRGV